MSKSILRRLGKKDNLLDNLLTLFPQHTTYIETFFGSGSVFFNKPLSKYNILNDLDSDVFNLFMVVRNQKEELEKAFYSMPIHADLLKYWKENKETDPIWKACRFLFLSNFTFMGKGDGVKLGTENHKKPFYKNIDRTNELLTNAQLLNCDAAKLINSISYKGNPKNYFAYCDPPYIDTENNYSDSYTKELSVELIETLISKEINFGMSEFDNPFILDLAKKYNLNIHYLGERQNLKNRRSEIYICNYKVSQLEMF